MAYNIEDSGEDLEGVIVLVASQYATSLGAFNYLAQAKEILRGYHDDHLWHSEYDHKLVGLSIFILKHVQHSYLN